MATVVALVGAMLWIDPMMTLVAGVIVPFAAPPVARIGKKLRRVSTSTQEQIGAMAGLVSESLAGARVEGLRPGSYRRAAPPALEDVRTLR